VTTVPALANATCGVKLTRVNRRVVSSILVSLALAIAIHLDWHAARPAHHHLSFGWTWHWALAIPVFALVAWYIAHAWPSQPIAASLWIVGGAIIGGGVLEPAWEYSTGATYDWAFGPERRRILATFLVSGLLAYAVALTILRKWRAP
jgi:hypothetical protein